jgi:putative ABC transport system permease protein
VALPLIIYRSLRQHALSTVVTAASIALASGLLLTVWMVKKESQAAFTQTATSFDAVLGARGSKLQLVLNAIFHLEASPGNIAWADYEAIRRHPLVKAAVPIAVGDNYRGYRLVGTLPDLLPTVDFAPGRRLVVQPGGRFIAGPQVKEAVVGSFAAHQLGLKVGDHFHPYHGLDYNPAAEHADDYVVVGLLAPTNTPADRVLWIPIEGLETMSGHAAQAATDLSAVLIQLRSPAAGFMLDQQYNRGNRLTFAYPVASIVAELFGKIAWFDRVLALVAYLVALVAAASVLASIYSSMSARRRDLAILRALGARRRTIFGAVVTEAACIGALGALVGFAVYFSLLFVIAAIMRRETGVVLDVTAYDRVLWLCPLAMTLLCALGGIVPAFKAYRTPVAETLAPLS